MKKHFFVTILVLILVLATLSACGKTNNNGDDTTSSSASDIGYNSSFSSESSGTTSSATVSTTQSTSATATSTSISEVTTVVTSTSISKTTPPASSNSSTTTTVRDSAVGATTTKKPSANNNLPTTSGGSYYAFAYSHVLMANDVDVPFMKIDGGYKLTAPCNFTFTIKVPSAKNPSAYTNARDIINVWVNGKAYNVGDTVSILQGQELSIELVKSYVNWYLEDVPKNISKATYDDLIAKLGTPVDIPATTNSTLQYVQIGSNTPAALLSGVISYTVTAEVETFKIDTDGVKAYANGQTLTSNSAAVTFTNGTKVNFQVLNWNEAFSLGKVKVISKASYDFLVTSKKADVPTSQTQPSIPATTQPIATTSTTATTQEITVTTPAEVTQTTNWHIWKNWQQCVIVESGRQISKKSADAFVASASFELTSADLVDGKVTYYNGNGEIAVGQWVTSGDAVAVNGATIKKIS